MKFLLTFYITFLLTRGTYCTAAQPPVTRLFHVAKHGTAAEISSLLRRGVNVNMRNSRRQTLLDVALERPDNAEMVLLLVKKGGVTHTTDTRSWSLSRAASNNYLGMVALLLGSGYDPNTAHHDGATPLFIAAQEGRFQVAELLLYYGSKPNVPRNDGVTPLYIAAENGHFQVVELLLLHRADLNIANNCGATPLYMAAQNGHFQAVKLLLEHGADPDIACDNGATPLYTATCKLHYEIVILLLNNGADINSKFEERTAIQIVVENRHYNTAMLLLNRDANVASIVSELFLAAVTAGKAAFARELMGKLNANFLTTHCRLSALHHAAYHGDVVEIKRLLTAGADPNARDALRSTALHQAVRNNCVRVARVLLQHGASVNVIDSSHQTPLHIAARKGWCDLIPLLSATVNERDSNLQTPLHLAAHYGHLETVRELVLAGAEIDILDNRRLTPLQLAVRNEHWEVALFLIGSGALVAKTVWHDQTLFHAAAASGQDSFIHAAGHLFDTNAVDSCGQTPLHYAVRRRKCSTISAIVAHGGNVNTLDNLQHSPLHHAVFFDYSDAVTVLLANNADFKLLGRNGETLLHLAAAGNCFHVIALLARHINVNARDNLLRAPLHYAAQNGSIHAAAELLRLNAWTSPRDASDLTPLCLARMNGHVDMIAFLIGRGATLGMRADTTPVSVTCGHGYWHRLSKRLRWLWRR